MLIEESLPRFLLPTVILSSRVGFAAAAQPGRIAEPFMSPRSPSYWRGWEQPGVVRAMQ